jgi:hypothetical protein
LLKKRYVFIILLALILAALIGIEIGYNLCPFGTFECFKRLKYQNITCYRDGNNYHCLTQSGAGYIIENVK